MLVLIGLTATLVISMPSMALPVLFSEISESLGLNLVQAGVVWGIGSFAGLLTALLGGAIGDRFGTKRTIAISCLAIGLTGALRGFSNDFASLAITMLLTGIVGSVVPMNLHKACGVWFSGKHLGLANGVVSAGMALGFMFGSMISASVLSPWLGGWRQVLFFYGGIAVIMSLPWIFSRSEPVDKNSTVQRNGTISIRKSLGHVFRVRNVWLLGFVLLGVGGCVQGLLGYLPLYLRESGWPPLRADTVLASFHAISLLSVFPLVYLSDRLGTRKLFLIITTSLIAMGVGLLTVAEGTVIWVAVLIAGAARDGFMALIMTATTELKGIGPIFAGTAIGLVMTLSNIGGLLAPILGNSLATYNLHFPFILWAAMALLGVALLITMREEKNTSFKETNI